MLSCGVPLLEGQEVGEADQGREVVPAEPVDRGDDGYQSGSHFGFLSGGLYVSVDAPGASSAEALAGLQQLAEVVASNL